MSLTLTREPLDYIRESGLEPLLLAHWQEVAHDQGDIPLEVDWDGYKEDERTGKFLGLALRKSGKLIGYTAFYVAKSRHYKNHIFAVNDVVYLKPEERGVDGIWMIEESERVLKSLGVAKVFYHCKSDAILGSVAGDSLEAIENRLELEELLGRELPQEIDGGRTLGSVLVGMGYSHVESNFGRLLMGKN